MTCKIDNCRCTKVEKVRNGGVYQKNVNEAWFMTHTAFVDGSASPF